MVIRTMLRICLVGLCLIGAASTSNAADPKPPLSLHPDNSHYFLFRGKPAVLIGSAEHYGAVLNLDFDYVRYLDELAARELNHTRTFSGAYVEPQGAFNIEKNTLAPAPKRFLSPWARSTESGYANGGNKFDLTKWDDAYFSRLKDFVGKASERGIIVEFALFCPFYEEVQWNLSPQNADNNVNGLGRVSRTDVYTLDRNGGLLAIHDALVRKVIDELRGFDNLYYEVCNEPYFGGVTMDWQRHIVDVIALAEKELPHQHLISLNIANGSKKIEDAPSGVSIFNFHYASPPDAVAQNFGLKRAIGDNETGFKGTADTHYRMEAWEFLIAGGALYSHLDYSFAVGHEDGSFQYPPTQPGGGNAGFRERMRHLKRFLNRFDYLKMQPDNTVLKGGLPEKGRARALVEPGRQYAVYLFGGPQARLKIELPGGEYDVEWISPRTGKSEQRGKLSHPGGEATLESPTYDPDVALRVTR
jgi:hypothetical protein